MSASIRIGDRSLASYTSIDADLIEAVDDFVSSLTASLLAKDEGEEERLLSIADSSLEYILVSVSERLDVERALEFVDDDVESLEYTLSRLGPGGLRSLILATLESLNEPHADKALATASLLRIIAGFNKMLTS